MFEVLSGDLNMILNAWYWIPCSFLRLAGEISAKDMRNIFDAAPYETLIYCELLIGVGRPCFVGKAFENIQKF
jgi:hypothetical protein